MRLLTARDTVRSRSQSSRTRVIAMLTQLLDVVGPDEANLKRAGRSRAILMVYDIFGYSPQLIQGADILARGDTRQQYTVFVPDILEGNWADKKM